MAWEPVDRWPGDDGGEGAFRASSEPVVAERGGPTAWERARLWWHSTPEMPIEHVARRVAVTRSFVYVSRANGRRERAPREKLRGVRRSGARVIFGVVEGEDLVLPFRKGCAVIEELLRQLGPGADEAWTGWRGFVPGLLVTGAGIAVGAALLATYPWRPFVSMIEKGLWTSETALGFYGGWVALLVGILGATWVPMRARVDRLGVEIRRGLIPWLPFFRPAERFIGVRVREVMGNQRGVTTLLGHEVSVVFREPERFVSILSRGTVPVAWFSASNPPERASGEAKALANWLAKILDVPVQHVR